MANTKTRPMRAMLNPVLVAILLTLAPEIALAQGSQIRRGGEPPDADRVGGFVLSIFGGSQFVGSTAAQAGFTLTYFTQPGAVFGLELESAITFGPSGRVYHGLFNFVLQTGARVSRITPYIVAGVGAFIAKVDLSPAIDAELEQFGIELIDTTERGPMFDFGLGVRYFFSDSTSVRIDYREFRALRDSDEQLFDRIFALRRIAGMLMFEF